MRGKVSETSHEQSTFEETQQPRFNLRENTMSNEEWMRDNRQDKLVAYVASRETDPAEIRKVVWELRGQKGIGGHT